MDNNGEAVTADKTKFSAAVERYAAPTTTTERLLSEVLVDITGIEQVSVDSHFFDDLGADSMVMTRFCARLRKKTDLPPVPIKKVYAHPTISSLATALTAAAPTPTEQLLSQVLADIMSVEQVSVNSHFFDDLGADSMVMARFCARLRKQTDLPPVPIKKVYAHPTVNRLATALNGANGAAPVPSPTSEPALARAGTPIPAEESTPIGTPRYLLCAALQVLSVSVYLYILTFALAQGYEFISTATRFIDIYWRSVLVGFGVFLGMSLLPILLKWMIIGRWRPQQIRIWSLHYFRFWFAKTLMRLNPLALFAGSPIYALYLRAMGAKIGRGVVILSRHAPVCTDLLTVGDNTVIRKDSLFGCYRAHDGLIQTGSVTIGKDATVGEKTVLDIETAIGDGAQLGHSSSLNSGQSIPDDEHRVGSPARERTDVDYRGIAAANCGLLRKIAFSAIQLISLLFLSSILFSAAVILAPIIGERLFPISPDSSMFLQGAFYVNTLIISSVFFFGLMLFGLVLVATVPRLLNLAIKPDAVYPLYGLRYLFHRIISRLTNVRFFVHLFGDSSFIVYYLRWIGYEFTNGIVQTGSNFGSAVKHDNPFLVSVGRGTMVADDLSIINGDFTNTSFRLTRATIGPNNFFGNQVAYPAQGKTGDNCLLATKVMVPVDGDVREGVGLLGSPSFEIPRSVMRDIGLDHPQSPEELSHQLAAKNKHNLITMSLYLLAQWIFSFGLILLLYGAANLYQAAGIYGYLVAGLLALIFRVFFFILVERASTLFQALRPQACSIYNPKFWSHERYWKLAVLSRHLRFLNGTPFKSLVWRLLGVEIGKRVFDDGCVITEKTMVAIGDNCTLNAGSVIQGHSQEDGGFKSDYITIGAGCTLGVNSLVHYGATMGDGAQLAADAFLMKGEEVPPHTWWGDNPAMEVQDNTFAGAAITAVQQPGLGEKSDSENYKIPIKQAA